MTKIEFNEWLVGFNKMPGEYSDEELYRIGVEHKNLLKEEKSWSNLAAYVGWEGSPNSYRQWVLRRQEADGTLVRNNKLLNEKTVDQLSAEEAKNNINKQMEDLQKEKQQVWDHWNAYRRSIRDDARITEFKDLITKSVETLNALPKVIPPDLIDYKCEKEAILMLSDIHIGVDCDNAYNTYNTNVAAARLGKLAQDTINYCKALGVTKLNILNMGDLVHGIIHTSARLEQQFDITKQIMTASELLANFINTVKKAAPIITYRSVTDNHSRAVANKEEAIEKENFNKIIDWYLESRLNDGYVEFLHDNLDDGIGYFKLMNGKKVIFAHGHQDNINTSMQNFVGLTHEWIDYILLAHMHCAKSKEFQGATVVVNGSVCGTEQYAFGRRLFNEASQTLLVFDDDNTLNIKIKLS